MIINIGNIPMCDIIISNFVASISNISKTT